MDLADILRDGLTLFVALATLVGAAAAVGIWIGRLTTRQGHTEAELSELKAEIQQMRRDQESTIQEQLNDQENQLSKLLE